jgi:NAD dependent epimerase/dehydratase family enzyme
VLFGEMGEALLLSSTRVEPVRLQASGYTFRHPELEGALRHILGRAA